MGNYNIEWTNSISEIDKSEWQKLFSNCGAICDYDFITSIENSNLPGIQHLYLSIYKSKKCYAILPCFIYNFDLSILSGDKTKRFVNTLRVLKKNFLRKNILFAGTPLAVCNHLIGINKSLINSEKVLLLKTIKEELKRKKNESNCSLLIIKEISESQRYMYDSIFLNDFLVLDSLPNSYIVVLKKYMDFPNYLRSRYKKNINRKIRAFEACNLTWEEKREYEEFVGNIHRLYLNTFNKSENKFEILNEDFFYSIQKTYKNHSFVSIAKDNNGDIKAMILFIHDKKTLTPLYLGIEYNKTEDSEIYFNCIYHIISLAEEFDCQIINLGQTSYNAKIYSGAFIENLYIYVYAKNILVRKIINNFSSYLFPKMKIEMHNCFTNEAMQIINKLIINKQ